MRFAVVEIDAGGPLVGLLGDGVVDTDLEPVQLLPVHRVPGLGRVVHVLVVHKAEAARLLAGSIQHQIGLLKRAELAELVLEVLLCSLVAEAEHAEAVVRFGRFPVPLGLLQLVGGARAAALARRPRARRT